MLDSRTFCRKFLVGVKRQVLLSLLLLASVVYAGQAFAQSKKVTITNQSMTMADVVHEVEKQTGYMFVYNNKDVDLSKVIKVDVKDLSVADLLTKLFKPAGISYQMNGNNILLITSSSQKSSSSNAGSGKQAHHKQIEGTVKDRNGEPIIGAGIKVKGGKGVGTVTNVEGAFKLDVPDNASLEVSYIGYTSQIVKTGDQKTFNIVLQEDNKLLEEVVVVGYGNQKRINVAGSVASVKGDDLIKSPVSTVSNALSGKMPGLVTLQSSGLPGSDGATMKIRGFDAPLVLIDGSEGDISTVDANEIESISILKDASASIYGARAGNGVILITTKRGVKGKPTLTLNTSFTWQGITDMPKMASAGQMAELAREGHLQSGQPEATAPYTEEVIKKYYDGTDPQYPNTDWYRLLIRDWAPQQQHNLAIRGGSDNIKFYGFLGYLNQETLFKRSDASYRRYNIRGSIDAKITDDLSASMDFSLVVGERNYTQRDMNANLWSDFWNTSPMYPDHFPDLGKVPFAEGGGTGGAHITTNRSLSGYNDTRSQETRFTGELRYDFPFLKGLQAKTRIDYLQTYATQKIFQKPVPFWKYDHAAQKYTLAGSFGSSASLGYILPNDRRMIYQTSLEYKKVLKEIHDINVLALFEATDYYSSRILANRSNFLTPAIDEMLAGSTEGMTNGAATTEMGRMSWVGRFNYTLMSRYILDATLRADASAKFPKESRWGYFPSVSLAWRINEEAFMKQIKDLDALKLRLSYGTSGNDNVGNFAYLAGYDIMGATDGGSYIFGSTKKAGIWPKGLANPDLTWEKLKIYNAGFDVSFWKGLLYGSFEIFYRKRTGIPGTRLITLPSTFGATLPQENLNSTSTRGFELTVASNGRVGELGWDVSANVSWARSKWDYYEEPDYTDPDQRRINRRTGQWTDRQFGYIAEGLFGSQEEIDNLPYNQDKRNNTTLRPGDVRYRDVNGDKVIDWKDEVEIGQGTIPTWFAGFNPTLHYKGFDLSLAFQGAFGFDIIASLGGQTENYFNARWTPQNNDRNALIPRVGGNSGNTHTSTYWLVPGNYVRWKSFTLSYTFKHAILKTANINSIRLFFSGSNLYTWSKLKKYGLDPEMPSGKGGLYYPQQRNLSIGATVIF